MTWKICAEISIPRWRRFDRHFSVQPFEETLVDGFRGDLPNKVGVRDVLANYLLDRVAIPWLGFDEQDRFSFFHNPLFPTISASDWKPVGANRQSLLEKDTTDLTCLIGRVQRDVIDSHDPSKQASYFIRSNVFWSTSRSVGLPSFARVVSIHLRSNAFLVGRSFSKKTPKSPGKGTFANRYAAISSVTS